MAMLEWLFLGTLIGGIVFLLLSMLCLILFFYNKNKIKEINNIKTKNKSKRKKQKQDRQKFRKAKTRALISFVIFLVVGLSSSGASKYVSYYQSVNLSQKDSESVVEAYYLITDFEKQLSLASEEKENEDNVSEGIRKYATQMASFNSRTASSLNKEDGQILLNRYYNIVKEIGINASNQSNDFYGNQELSDEFLVDIKRAKEFQENVFDYYKVDEKALKKEI